MADPRAVLDVIRQRADNATNGPWSVTDGRGIHSRVYRREDQREVQDDHERRIAHYVEPSDAEFIAAARSDVPRLVAALTAVLDMCKRNRADEWTDRMLPASDIEAVIEAALTEEES